jgi:hypothetical protein
MATYQQDMRKAAIRHLEAGETLRPTGRYDVAGYLFGIAAECAIKYIMLGSGMRPLTDSQRRDDPFYAHFEQLKTMLRDKSSGRRATQLRQFAERSSFMQRWDVSMRYSHGQEIKPQWVDGWQKDASYFPAQK